MQETVKKKSGREGGKEKRQAVSGAVWLRRLRRAWEEVKWGACGAILGQAQMLFGTYPLGLALLCGSSRHTLSIFVGLVISALLRMGSPLVYICTYALAAMTRVVAGLLFENPDGRVELPESLRQRLVSAQEHEGQVADQAGRESARGEGLLHFPLPRAKGSDRDAAVREHGLRALLLALLNEGLGLRVASGGICALILMLYRIIAGGFRYYDFFAALFAVLLTPIAALVYSVCLDERIEQPILRYISQALLLFSVVWGANTVAVWGLSLSVVLALFFTLYACAQRGAAIGIGTGVLCGLAYNALYAPAFVLAALVYLLLKKLQRESAGALLGGLAMLIWSVYVGGPLTLVSFLPSALLAGCALTLTLRARPMDATEESTDADLSVVRQQMEGERYRDSSERFRGISDAFSTLSEMFYNLSDRFRRPGTLDLRRICDTAFDTICVDCPNKSVCWGLEYTQTLGVVNELIAGLHTKGKVSRKLIPDALSHRCDAVDAILEKINRDCATLTGELLRNNRTEIFAMDYEAASQIINDALEEDDGEYRFDSELELRISEYLADAGVRAGNVTVYGNRRRQILVRGVDVELARVTVDTLRADLSEMCGMELCRPVFEVEGSLTTMILRAKKKISVNGAQNNVSADGGVSGDSVTLFSNKQDYFYALINDGMGSGREAALTSNLCSVFLEKMLRAGNRAGTSMRMLNNLIRSRGSDSTRECSSTVDLLELDLMTAKAAFIKSGAAPSFVIRGKVVHRIQSGTAPIGIISELDVQSTPFSLRAGDTVVIVSDGILQNDPECEWLASYLADAAQMTPQEIVYRICLHACDCAEHDDCSAIALQITSVGE